MTKSLWRDYTIPSFPALCADIDADVCIVGAGIAGLTTAYLFARSGRRVVLVTDGEIAGGESGSTTAQINTVHDDSWSEMERLHGVDGTRLCAESYQSALNFIADTVAQESIDCGFEYVPGYLFAAEEMKEEKDWFQNELDAARRAGVSGVRIVPTVAGLCGPDGRTEDSPALRYDNQAQFHPVAYLSGLSKAIVASGHGAIFTGTHVSAVEDRGGHVTVHTENGPTIHAGSAVLATNVPIHQRFVPHDAMAPYRSYVVVFDIPFGRVPLAQYWDNGDPYHYVRVQGSAAQLSGSRRRDGDLLIVGGEDHRVADLQDADLPYERLKQWAAERFPAHRGDVARWSAQTIETFDGMPLLGRSSHAHKNIFIIAGDSGTGMTHGTIGAMLNFDLITKDSNPWQRLYDPLRPRTRGLKRWLRENIHTAANYRDWLLPGEVHSEDEIAPLSGAIVRRGLQKIAVYRDADGHCFRYSAVCPHLGGILRWNSVEKSWDCPAHGSRFSCMGNILNGPANTRLQTLREGNDGCTRSAKSELSGTRASDLQGPEPASAPGQQP